MLDFATVRRKKINGCVGPEKMKLEVQLTEDGSHTLFRPDLNESYHSHKGAMGESLHVFIKEGLRFFRDSHKHEVIRVFEVGFGTGLNAWLSYEFAKNNHQKVSYVGLEPIPVPEEIWQELNYTKEKSQFDLLHSCSWDEQHFSPPYFDFAKKKKALELYEPDQKFDIVFMDAFAPSKQPEVWKKENLAKCFSLLTSEGILVTYCAQGQFKRDLKAVGFSVESLEGALGKKEMVRATKP